ncbi:hypothetical protein [Halomonas salifodinae]|uniref:hypothetical protein n=1 Tax=Halomonas salifodinae TaxID=438745 RepID=UPI0033BD48F2
MLSRKTFALAAAIPALGLASLAMADDHEPVESDRALVILTSDSLYTQGMAMILSNAMQQQGTELNILLCDGAGELAVEGYASPETIATPPANPAGEVVPETLLGMLMNHGANVEVCAIFLPNTDHEAADLKAGVGVAAPGPIAEMMRDPAIPVYSF